MPSAEAALPMLDVLASERPERRGGVVDLMQGTWDSHFPSWCRQSFVCQQDQRIPSCNLVENTCNELFKSVEPAPRPNEQRELGTIWSQHEKQSHQKCSDRKSIETVEPPGWYCVGCYLARTAAEGACRVFVLLSLQRPKARRHRVEHDQLRRCAWGATWKP